MIDLVRRLAAAEGESPDDPIEWFNTRGSGQPDYSVIIESLAPGAGDRQALLDPFFEPTEDELEQGKKQPTAAHHAIADLVRSGFVRVIVTTNFDRLIERALADIGIEPTVIASETDAENAAPLHTLSAVVIKVHGDRRSPNLRNTLAELESYGSHLQALVGQVFSEYGLVIVGWSGEWDPALRKLLIENQPRLFTTFFTYRSEPLEKTQELIKARMAVPVQIEDADSFLSSLHETVKAILATRPDPAEVSAARLKLLMADERHRIRLQDLVMNSVERLIDATSVEHFPTEGISGEDVLDVFASRLKRIEEEAEEAMSLLGTLAFYADTKAHEDLLLRALRRIATVTHKAGGLVVLLPLQRYAATLCLYAAGVASVAAEHPKVVMIALVTIRGRDETSSDPTPIADWLTPAAVIDEAVLKKAIPELERRKTAASDHLFEVIERVLSPLIPSRDDLEGYFDDFEYLMGLACMEATKGSWGPAGRFTWRRRYPARGAVDRVIDQHKHELLNAGLAGGDAEALEELQRQYQEQLQRWHFRL